MRFFNKQLLFLAKRARSEGSKPDWNFDILDDRLHREATDSRIDVPDNLNRRILDALQETTRQSKPGLFHRWPMIVAPAGVGAIVLSLLLLSVQTPTTPIGPEQNPIAAGSPTFSLRSISSKNWLPPDSIRTASFTNPLMDEARGLYEDANNAAGALLASFPRSLRTLDDASTQEEAPRSK